MKWLVVFSPEADLEAANALLAAHDAKAISQSDVTPMENAEWTAPTEGPANLPQELRRYPQVLGVYPNSEMDYYGHR